MLGYASLLSADCEMGRSSDCFPEGNTNRAKPQSKAPSEMGSYMAKGGGQREPTNAKYRKREGERSVTHKGQTTGNTEAHAGINRGSKRRGNGEEARGTKKGKGKQTGDKQRGHQRGKQGTKRRGEGEQPVVKIWHWHMGKGQQTGEQNGETEGGRASRTTRAGAVSADRDHYSDCALAARQNPNPKP